MYRTRVCTCGNKGQTARHDKSSLMALGMNGLQALRPPFSESHPHLLMFINVSCSALTPASSMGCLMKKATAIAQIYRRSSESWSTFWPSRPFFSSSSSFYLSISSSQRLINTIVRRTIILMLLLVVLVICIIIIEDQGRRMPMPNPINKKRQIDNVSVFLPCLPPPPTSLSRHDNLAFLFICPLP